MPISDQGITADRYTLIPRVLIYIRRGDEYLLLKRSQNRKSWAGKYNGVGGHIERGEDVLSAARRELFEESGLVSDLWLCGTVIVDAGEIGVAIYVFVGEEPQGEIKPSWEGSLEWIRVDALAQFPLVEDVPALLSKIHTMKRGDPPFSARSYYDAQEKLSVFFAD